MSHFCPLPLTAFAALTLMCFCWLDMSTMDYHPQSMFGGRTTAGWFVLGFPMLLAFGAGIGLLFAWLAREKSHVLAWVSAILIAGLLVSNVITRTTPEARLAGIIGPEATALATIERLQQYDSFNDGSTRWGILSGSPGLMDAIRRHCALGHGGPTRLGLYPFFEDGFPEYGEVEIGDRVTFFVHPENGKTYFCQQPAPRRSER